MSFGYSFGDFVVGANLSYRLIRALSETCGASLEYQEAINELASIQHAFLQVGQMRPSSTLSRATINAASHIVLSSINLIAEFLEKTKQYRNRFCGGKSGNAVADGWRKMGWVLFKSDELKALRDALHTRMTNVTLLLSTAQFHGSIPANVGKYEVDRFKSPSTEPSSIDLNSPSGTSDSSETLIQDDIDESESLKQTETIVDDETADEYGPVKLVGQDSSAGEGTYDVAPGQREDHESPTVNSHHQPKAQVNAFTPGALGHSSEDDNLAYRDRQSHLDISSYEDKPKDNVEKPRLKTAKLASSKVVGAGILQKTNRPETPAGRNLSKRSKDARSQEEHLFARLEDVLQKVEGRSDDPKKQLPIKFKDAVGRKFTFPFHLCSKWAGMKELIKEAFLHVEVIGQHVAQGHYDLVGPTGEIILPQVWETTIQPDSVITMHMWPLPEPPKTVAQVVDADPPVWIEPPIRCDSDIITIKDNVKPLKKKLRKTLGGIFGGKRWKSSNDSDSDYSLGS